MDLNTLSFVFRNMKFYVHKHIAHLVMCYNPSLVRDKPLGAPAYVKLVYCLEGNAVISPLLAWWTGDVDSGTSVTSRSDYLHIMLIAGPSYNNNSGFEFSYVLNPRNKTFLSITLTLYEGRDVLNPDNSTVCSTPNFIFPRKCSALQGLTMFVVKCFEEMEASGQGEISQLLMFPSQYRADSRFAPSQ